MNCPRCNYPLRENENLCWICGAFIPQAPAQPVAPQYAQQPQGYYQQSPVRPQQQPGVPYSLTPEEMFQKSLQFFNGTDGIPQDKAQGAYWLRLAAEQGLAKAQHQLGICYRKGNGFPQDDAQSAYWTQKSALQGYTNAQYDLGVMYMRGVCIAKNITQAKYWFQKAAEQGHVDAQNNLGCVFEDCEDYDTATYWYRKAAEQGDATGQYNLGCLYHGLQNYAQAIPWFQKAASQGYNMAQYNLGIMYLRGEGISKDNTQAEYWLNKAADKDNSEAQRNLSVLYGEKKDFAKEIYWLHKAAENGNAEAQSTLGTGYYVGPASGYLVQQDYTQALYWIHRAVEQGHANAQAMLGIAYDEGNGVPQDSVQAVYWFQKAAEQGGAEAQSLLAASYEAGRGVQRNVEQAILWYQKAAEQGNANAKENLQRLLRANPQLSNQPAPAQAPVFCGACGTQAQPGTRFCTVCGATVGAAPAQAQQPQAYPQLVQRDMPVLTAQEAASKFADYMIRNAWGAKINMTKNNDIIVVKTLIYFFYFHIDTSKGIDILWPLPEKMKFHEAGDLYGKAVENAGMSLRFGELEDFTIPLAVILCKNLSYREAGDLNNDMFRAMQAFMRETTRFFCSECMFPCLPTDQRCPRCGKFSPHEPSPEMKVILDVEPIDLGPEETPVHPVTVKLDDGRQVTVDLDELTKKATQGDAVAQGALGVIYFNGDSIPEDYTQAAHWLRLSAEQGNASAQFNLGWMYYCTYCNCKDDSQAAHWFKKAAEQGHVMAADVLAGMYMQGKGVPQNLSQGQYWFRKADELRKGGGNQQSNVSRQSDDTALGKPVNKTAYALIAFFLGGLGIHKFMAGKAGMGVLYLLFCWTFIPAFIALIEGIIALTKTADAQGNIYV